jgi:aminoglycoside phosphotransferase (APT) family kinase protein
MTAINADDLARRLTAIIGRSEPGVAVGAVERLHGGASGLTYRAVVTGPQRTRQLIAVKVAPPGLKPVKNRDVLRQARIMRLLGTAGTVPVPPVLFVDAGRPPEVPPLFAMDYVDGQCWEPILDPIGTIPAAEEIRARELDVARNLGLLHAASLAQLGLAGEPVVTLEGELDRWARVIATIDEDLRPNCESIGDRLRASVPSPMAPVLQHGDFRLGNTLAKEGRVRAVIDWEIWAVGDPRVDLAWYLMSTHSSKQRCAVRDVDGMPSDEELVRVYQAASGLAVAELRWFEAFTQFKAAAITGQIIKHNRRSDKPNDVVSSWDPDLPPAFLGTAAVLLADIAA